MIFKKDIRPPVKQDLMYMAEYADGSYIPEFNLMTATKNPFEGLRAEGLIRLGLVGVSVPMYIETYGGFFHLAGRNIQVKYVTKDKEYYLIGHPRFYKNLFYYKTGMAELPMSPKAELIAWGRPEGEIMSFHFGYTEDLLVEGVNFKLTAECKVPYQETIKLKFNLQADQELNGRIVVIRSGVEIDLGEAPIDPNMGGEVEWTVM